MKQEISELRITKAHRNTEQGKYNSINLRNSTTMSEQVSDTDKQQAMQARIKAQLEILEMRPQVLNTELEILYYDGGDAGIGYEVDNVLEYSRTPLHRSGKYKANTTLILRCKSPLLLDYLRIETSPHVDYAVKTGVIWIFTEEHSDPNDELLIHSELFNDCTTQEHFDKICSQIVSIRNTEASKIHKKNDKDEDITFRAESIVSDGKNKSDKHQNQGEKTKIDKGSNESKNEFPDVFFFETDPITFNTTISLRNQNRIIDMESYIRDIFAEIDLNGDGELSMDELVPPLVKMGYSARFARQIVREADDDGNGVIDADEFTAHMSKLNLSSTVDTCKTVAIRMQFTSVHDSTEMKQQKLDEIIGTAIIDEKSKPTSFLMNLLKDTNSINDTNTNEDVDMEIQHIATKHINNIHSDESESQQKQQGKKQRFSVASNTKLVETKSNHHRKHRSRSSVYPPYLQCSYMCFCGHLWKEKPKPADPPVLFDHELFKPRHMRRPFINIAPPKMAPMPAPGPQVLRQLNYFDNEFIAHLNKAPCVVLYTANSDKIMAKQARETLSNLAIEMGCPEYPAQEMIHSTLQEVSPQ